MKTTFKYETLYRDAITATVWWYQREHHIRPPKNFTDAQMEEARVYWFDQWTFEQDRAEYKEACDALELYHQNYKVVQKMGERP